MKKLLSSILSVGLLSSIMSMAAFSADDTNDTNGKLIYYRVNNNDSIMTAPFTPDVSNLPGYSVKLALGASGIMFNKKDQSKVTTKVTKGSSVAAASVAFDKSVGNSGNWVLKVSIKDLAQTKTYPIVVQTVVKYTDPNTKNTTDYSSNLNFAIDDSLIITADDVIQAHKNEEDADPGPHQVEYVENRYIVSKEAFVEANTDGRKIEYLFQDPSGYAYSVEFKKPRNQATPISFKSTRQAINNITDDTKENTFAFIKFYNANKNTLADTATVKVRLDEYGTSRLWKNGAEVYVYEYDGDKLVGTDIKGTFDGTTQTISFDTKSLGTFVLAANAVNDATNPGSTSEDMSNVVEAPVVSEPTDLISAPTDVAIASDISDGQGLNAGNLPNTGSKDTLVMAGLVTLFTATLVGTNIYKKQKNNA